MTDEQKHDEPAMPEDAVEDLAPEGEDQDVSGGAVDMFLKIEGAPNMGDGSVLKIEPGGAGGFTGGV
jgi:hypothetical protein